MISTCQRWFAALFLTIAWGLSCAAAWGEDWPQWRGPRHDGTSAETGLPVTWSEDSGVAWKCELPPWGASTPAIWGSSVFVTTQADDRRLLVLKIDKSTGRIEWTRDVGEATAERMPLRGKRDDERRRQKFHATQNMASPSPVTDGRRVVVHFGNGDLAAYDFAGQRLWKRNLQKDYGTYSIWWGHANSPLLVGDTLISVCMQDNCADLPGAPSPSYIVAHDAQTGAVKWKVDRPTAARAEHGDSYATPVLCMAGTQPLMIVMGGQILDAYDPQSGRRIWHIDPLVGNRVITGPVVADGIVYTTQGMRQALLAVKLDGAGQRSPDDTLWQLEKGTPDSPTPTVYRGLLFLVSDNGIAKCLDAKTGKVHWDQRLRGDYRASPLAADGRVYFLSMKGLTTVVAASATFQRLAENTLDDETLASPVASGGRIFIRGHKRLYCLGK